MIKTKQKVIDDLMWRCRLAQLDGYADFIIRFDDATIMREYNGIGPEWMEPEIRDKVTKYFSLFEPAALIHDLRNYKSDGSEVAFHDANEEFIRNCKKLAKKKYSWYDWRRYRGLAVAHLLFDFVDGKGGWKAWTDCAEKNKKGNK